MHPPPRIALAIGLLAVFTVWITWRAKTLEGGLHLGGRETTLWNKPAPAFSLPSLDGRTVSLADFRGKRNLVIAFWASWCGPCKMELPVLKEFYRKAHATRTDFEILAISIDDGRADAEEAAQKLGLPFPVLLDAGQKAAAAYSVSAIPAMFVIDKSGKVTLGQVGFNAGVEYILAQQLGIDNSVIMRGTNAAAGN
jgi:peroxiredoxin